MVEEAGEWAGPLGPESTVKTAVCSEALGRGCLRANQPHHQGCASGTRRAAAACGIWPSGCSWRWRSCDRLSARWVGPGSWPGGWPWVSEAGVHLREGETPETVQVRIRAMAPIFPSGHAQAAHTHAHTRSDTCTCTHTHTHAHVCAHTRIRTGTWHTGAHARGRGAVLKSRWLHIGPRAQEWGGGFPTAPLPLPARAGLREGGGGRDRRKPSLCVLFLVRKAKWLLQANKGPLRPALPHSRGLFPVSSPPPASGGTFVWVGDTQGHTVTHSEPPSDTQHGCQGHMPQGAPGTQPLRAGRHPVLWGPQSPLVRTRRDTAMCLGVPRGLKKYLLQPGVQGWTHFP